MILIIVVFAGIVYAYSEQGALDKIDWGSIDDGTIVLLSNEWGFNNVPLFDFNHLTADNNWRAFVPSKDELVKFLQYYEFEIVPVEKDGKKVFVIKEVRKRDLPLPGAFDLLPPELQDAALNLKQSYPSCFSGSKPQETAPAAHVCGDSPNEDPCGDECCDTTRQFCCSPGNPSCWHPAQDFQCLASPT